MSDKSSIWWELLRKSFHLAGVLVIVGYTLLFGYFSKEVALLGLTAAILVTLIFEFIRLEHRAGLFQFVERAFRPHECDRFCGAFYIIVAATICFAVFDYWIAFLAILMMVFGDIFAALVGKSLPSIKIYKEKSLAGTSAGFIANVLIGMLILPDFPWIVLPMAATASIIETLSNRLDDNITVPLFAGFAGQILIYVLTIHLPAINFSFL